MSRSFNGTTDRLNATVTALVDGDYTMGAWIYPLSAGEGNSGNIVRLEQAGTVRQALRLDQASLKLLSFQSYTTTSAVGTSVQTLPINAWSFVAVSHRASDNTLRMYIGDLDTAMAEVTYSPAGIGSGTFNGSATTANIGANGSNAETFDGRIAQAFVIATELSVDDLEAFRLGDWAVLYRTTIAPTFFAPLDSPNNAQDIARQITFTITGSAYAEDPPIAAGFIGPAVHVEAHTAAVTFSAAPVPPTRRLLPILVR